MRLNYTLREHLPDHLRASQGNPKEWALVVLAWENCERRMRLACPDDVLTESEFIVAVNDLLKSMGVGTFNGRTLDHYLKLGLIVPRYYARRFVRQGGSPIFLPFRTTRCLVYDTEGRLQAVQFGPAMSPVDRYREQEMLIEDPELVRQVTKKAHKSAAEHENRVRKYTPLFTFSQIGQVLERCRNTHIIVDLLTLTPKEYEKLRNCILSPLKAELEKHSSARFCTGPGCMKPLPTAGHKRRYCSKQCRQAALNARKLKPQAPGGGTLQLPFESFTGEPPLPSIE